MRCLVKCASRSKDNVQAVGSISSTGLRGPYYTHSKWFHASICSECREKTQRKYGDVTLHSVLERKPHILGSGFMEEKDVVKHHHILCEQNSASSELMVFF